MDLIAVPTGGNQRVAAYGYRGGSFFDKRDFNIGASGAADPNGCGNRAMSDLRASR
jgi:N-acyl homoserine lactone hydrolase